MCRLKGRVVRASHTHTEFRGCVRVEVAVLMSLTVSVDVQQH